MGLMKIYILFGKIGSGKSFVGDHLQNNYGFHHFDGDWILTDKMKEFVEHGKKFTQEMVDEYTENLKEKIKFFYDHYTIPIVISQGLYRNKNRLDILKEFPNIQYIFIHADDKLCYDRVETRKNWITLSYAMEISQLFESPHGFNYATIINNRKDILSLEVQIEKQQGIKKKMKL